MPFISQILVVEPRKDPDLEKAVLKPGVDVRYARDMDEALKATVSLLPDVIIMGPRVPEAVTWKWVTVLWDASQKRSHHLFFILLAEDAQSWPVHQFGPVRFTDRGHLSEAMGELLSKGSNPGSPPERAPEAAWETIRDTMWTRGKERLKAEQERLRALGILDERGRPTSKDWPADMQPGSKTDVAT